MTYIIPMITTTFHCRQCGSPNIIYNGRNRVGNQQYLCKDCRASGVLTPKPPKYTTEQRETILRAYQERPSMRGIQRIFGVSRNTLAKWIKAHVQALPPVEATVPPAQADDVLEVDEAWSFVKKKDNKRWLWTVLLRRTRQILAYILGDHSADTCRQLWQRIPPAYRQCTSFSDFWDAYLVVFPNDTHQCVGKETGETAHQERWYNTLRQRIGRYVRKTLSFSKSDVWHDRVTYWFIISYNLSL